MLVEFVSLRAIRGNQSSVIPLATKSQIWANRIVINYPEYVFAHGCYLYDALGRRFKTTYPDAMTVERTYTNRSQLHQTKFNWSVIDTRVYDVGGRLSTSTYANSAVPDSTGFVRINRGRDGCCQPPPAQIRT